MSMIRNAANWLRTLLALVGLAVILITCTPLVSCWAHVYAGSIERPSGDVLVVLSAARDDAGALSYSSYWRARYAVLAWRGGAFKTIVVSCAGPAMLEFMESCGIPRNSIILETRSTSTRENGIETAKILSGLPGTKVLLTSDFHMYRAHRVFSKLGVQVVPMPVPDAMNQLPPGKAAIPRSRNWS